MALRNAGCTASTSSATGAHRDGRAPGSTCPRRLPAHGESEHAWTRGMFACGSDHSNACRLRSVGSSSAALSTLVEVDAAAAPPAMAVVSSSSRLSQRISTIWSIIGSTPANASAPSPPSSAAHAPSASAVPLSRCGLRTARRQSALSQTGWRSSCQLSCSGRSRRVAGGCPCPDDEGGRRRCGSSSRRRSAARVPSREAREQRHHRGSRGATRRRSSRSCSTAVGFTAGGL